MNCLFTSRDQYDAFITEGVSPFEEYESGVAVFPAASSCSGFYDWMCGVSLRVDALIVRSTRCGVGADGLQVRGREGGG